MSVLSWGKPCIEIAALNAVSGEPENWQTLTIPKDGTTTLEVTEGDKTEAIEEGGGIVDTYQKKNKYKLSFELFNKKGDIKPIADNDGVILQNYAVRLTPEDPTCKGFMLKKCSVSVLDAWTAADGATWKYSLNGLTPTDGGKTCREFVPMSVSPSQLTFASEADSTGEEITVVNAEGTITATSSNSFATATVSGTIVTVTVTANTGVARSSVITITASGVSRIVNVTQAASTVGE